MNFRGVDSRGLLRASRPATLPIFIISNVKPLLDALLWFYVLELVLNRILIRTLIFIPHNVALDILATVTTYGGRLALNLTLILGVAVLLLGYKWSVYTIPILIAVILDYVGLFRLYWVLVIVALAILVRDLRRVAESTALVSLALASHLTNPIVQYIANIAWIIAPLPNISRRMLKALRWSLPLAALTLAATIANPYIMGQILIFGMGILTPWMLPPAIILYSLASPSMGRYSLLITGPHIQLSNQIITVASLYLGDMASSREEEKGGEQG